MDAGYNKSEATFPRPPPPMAAPPPVADIKFNIQPKTSSEKPSLGIINDCQDSSSGVSSNLEIAE